MTVLVDTSFLFALFNRNDASHAACAQVAQELRERVIIPTMILPEIAYLTEERIGHHAMRRFIAQLLDSAWAFESPGVVDLERAVALLEQYADSRLDFVDSTIVAIAERVNIRRILTLDQRHFRMIRPLHCPAFELLPA